VVVPPINTVDYQKIGILVRSELSDWDVDSNFIRTACFQPEALPLPNIQVKWRNPDQHPLEGITFFSGTYAWRQPQKYQVTLLGIPRALRSDFRPGDLQFPFPLVGCVLIVNLCRAFTIKAFIADQGEWPSVERQFELQKIWTGEVTRPKDMPSDASITIIFKKIVKDMRYGAITWIKLHKLPFVVVPIELRTPAFPLPALPWGEVADLLELEPHIPVISCPLKYNYESIEQHHFSFSSEDVERVLVALVEQIEKTELS
jgi:hypothetical protein